MRNDIYTGGEHYWVRFWNGTYEVRKETPDYCNENETVFTGHYEDCLSFLKNLQIVYAEYDLNI